MIEIQGAAKLRHDGPDLPCRLVIEADDEGDVSLLYCIDRPADHSSGVVDIDYLWFVPDDD